MCGGCFSAGAICLHAAPPQTSYTPMHHTPPHPATQSVFACCICGASPRVGCFRQSPAPEYLQLTLPLARLAAPPPRPSLPPLPADLMAFNGAGPELINGRLAMLGFVAALGAEVASGSRVTQQLFGAAGPIALTFALFTAASVIPLLKGNKNTESFGKLTPAVELLNGRAAMVSAVAAVCLVWLLAAWRYPAAPRVCLPAVSPPPWYFSAP